MNKKHRFLLGFLLASCLWLAQACSSSAQKENPEQVREYPRIVIDDSLVGPSPDLLELSDEFVQNFLQVADKYEGEHPKMKADFPSDWGMVGWEQLPEGKELWLIQSQNREWTYLVITSGFGTQRIKDVVPIGVDLATGGNDFNERELWTWKREDDAFVVDKYYELKKDVRDTTLKNVSSHRQDKYLVNGMGLFEFVPIVLKDSSRYRALIAYNDAIDVPGNWAEMLLELEPFCEENDIYFVDVNCNFKRVAIRDYKLKNVATMDVTPYMRKGEAGFVLVEEGEQPTAIQTANAEYLEMKMNHYFQIP